MSSSRGVNRVAQAQEEFDSLRELKMLEFSIEALVLEQPWASLFTPRELEIARRTLAGTTTFTGVYKAFTGATCTIAAGHSIIVQVY